MVCKVARGGKNGGTEMNEKALRKAEEYIKTALEMGAKNAVRFDIGDICFDSRTLLKCMFGCPGWGKKHTCPAFHANVSMAEYKEMLSRYSWGIIVGAKDKVTAQRASLKLESMAFHDGYYFAFSMSNCAMCATCAAADGEPCRFVKHARPEFHSVGIDVFKTVRGLGLPIETLESRDAPDQNWYSAVFVE